MEYTPDWPEHRNGRRRLQARPLKISRRRPLPQEENLALTLPAPSFSRSLRKRWESKRIGTELAPLAFYQPETQFALVLVERLALGELVFQADGDGEVHVELRPFGGQSGGARSRRWLEVVVRHHGVAIDAEDPVSERFRSMLPPTIARGRNLVVVKIEIRRAERPADLSGSCRKRRQT